MQISIYALFVEHVCQRDIAIYFDQKQRSWSFRKFEDFTDCLEEEMAGGSINFIRYVLST